MIAACVVFFFVGFGICLFLSALSGVERGWMFSCGIVGASAVSVKPFYIGLLASALGVFAGVMFVLYIEPLWRRYKLNRSR